MFAWTTDVFWIQVRARLKSLTVQAKIVCRDQKLKAQLDGDIHVGDVLFVLVLVPEMEIFDNFLQNHTAEDSTRAERTKVVNKGLGIEEWGRYELGRKERG